MSTSEEDPGHSPSSHSHPIYRVPWENLKLYLAEAIPRPPVYGFPAFNRIPRDQPAASSLELSVIPEARRKLRHVMKLSPHFRMGHIITLFCEKHLPDHLIPNGDTIGKFRRYMSLFAPSFDMIEAELVYGVHKIHFHRDMMSLFLEPLRVVERAITMIWPNKAWEHTCELLSEQRQAYPETYGDSLRCRCIVYRRMRGDEGKGVEVKEVELLDELDMNDKSVYELPKVGQGDQDEAESYLHDPSDKRVLIMTVSPWKFTMADFELFSSTFETVEDIDPFSRTQVVYTEHQKLWMKLWDECAGRQSPFFVLTNYEFWLIGVFTDGWTRAVVCDVFARDAENPTVVQRLFYWFASALEVPGAFSLPTDYNRQSHPDIRHPTLLQGWPLFQDDDLAEEEWVKEYVGVSDYAGNSRFSV